MKKMSTKYFPGTLCCNIYPYSGLSFTFQFVLRRPILKTEDAAKDCLTEVRIKYLTKS